MYSVLDLADVAFLSRTNLWSPIALGSSLGLWLDAADASTITLNGSTVSQWNDKSGKGRNVSQGTASKQPTYTVAGQNGRNILTFNGVAQQSLFASSSIINIPQPFTRFVVGQFLTKSNLSVMLDSEIATDQCVFYNGETGSTSWVVANGFNPTFANFSYGTRDFLNHQHYHLLNGSDSTWGIDGSDPTLAPNSPGPRGQGGIRIGNIRTEFINTYGFTGRIFEIILVEGVISNTNRQQAEGYLAWKWGLVANLPSGHPYKLTPPLGR